VRRLDRYAVAVASVVAATLLTFVLEPWMGRSFSMFFFPAVLVTALYGGYPPALLATVLAALSLAYFFIEPVHSFSRLGVDDAIRLGVFNVVALSTALLRAARSRAEIAQQQTLVGLRAALDTLQKVSGWPLVMGSDTAASTQNVLRHGAKAVNATSVMGVWESEEEPWIYTAAADSSTQSSRRYAPADVTPIVSSELEGATLLLPGGAAGKTLLVKRGDRVVETSGEAFHPRLRDHMPDGPIASAAFRTENLAGRIYFGGLASATADIVPAVEVVAREIGNSLDHLHVAERMRELALRDDRLRVSRDLHDGVLQALTGIRLELQDLAGDCAGQTATHTRLLAAERALATEQRELRRFIEGLKLAVAPPPDGGNLASTLRGLTARLSIEWETPIAIRVAPPDMTVADELEQPLRLMVHEAVINALKHGHPSRVAVTIEATDSRLSLTVTDDGRGFPFRGRLDHEALLRSDAAPVSLRDRVAALNGRIAIDSGARGARVEITLPAA
jgi:signal transduction histidine kinase